MVLNNASVLAGSPSVDMDIGGRRRNLSEPFHLFVKNRDTSYRIRPLMENFSKPGFPTDPFWDPSLDTGYSFLCIEKKVPDSRSVQPLTPEDVTDLSDLLHQMGKGEYSPIGENGKPVKIALSVAIGHFLEPRMRLAIKNYVEGQTLVEKQRLEDALIQQKREIPGVPLS
jgi:hypothetical protein